MEHQRDMHDNALTIGTKSCCKCTSADNGKLHDAGGIILVVEFDQLIASVDPFFCREIPERDQVARSKVPEGMGTTRKMFAQLEESTTIHLQVAFELRVHCANLTIGATLVERRRDEKLRESVWKGRQKQRHEICQDCTDTKPIPHNRIYDPLSLPVQGLLEVSVSNLKMKVGVVQAGRGVGLSGMLSQELFVIVLARIFFRS
jgi:hypothetical protein